MDPQQWMQLADAGAAAIIGAMATDAWHGVRNSVARFFGGSPQQDEEAMTWLEQQRQLLLAGSPVGRDGESAVLRARLAAALLRRIAEEPAAASRLDDLVTALSGQGRPSVNQRATATLGGQVNQAGRDLTMPPANGR